MEVAAWLNGAVAGGVAGALAGGLCSYILFRLQLRADKLASLVDDACERVREVEDRGIAYWQLGHGDTRADLFAVDILTGIDRIESAVTSIRDVSRKRFGQELDVRLYAFRRAVSGGSFGVAGRASEPQRASGIRAAANALVEELRRGR